MCARPSPCLLGPTVKGPQLERPKCVWPSLAEEKVKRTTLGAPVHAVEDRRPPTDTANPLAVPTGRALGLDLVDEDADAGHAEAERAPLPGRRGRDELVDTLARAGRPYIAQRRHPRVGPGHEGVDVLLPIYLLVARANRVGARSRGAEMHPDRGSQSVPAAARRSPRQRGWQS